MARRASRLTGGAAAARTGGGDSAARPRDGIITGYLLKQIRQSAGLSQEGLAERLGVDTNTVQGWETGRRSLTGTRVATLVELRHRLRQLGADPQLLAALEDAAEADYVLAYTLGTEPGAGAPDAHPLACWVPKRSFAYLLAWPFTGQPPIAVRQPAAPTRRGPVAPAPVLTQEERTRFFEHLRMVAEQSLSDRRLDEAKGMLLRRNVVLLAVVASEQRDNGVAARVGAARSATTRPLGVLVAVVDGRAFAGGGSCPSRGQGATSPLHRHRRSAPTPARPPT